MQGDWILYQIWGSQPGGSHYTRDALYTRSYGNSIVVATLRAECWCIEHAMQPILGNAKKNCDADGISESDFQLEVLGHALQNPRSSPNVTCFPQTDAWGFDPQRISCLLHHDLWFRCSRPIPEVNRRSFSFTQWTKSTMETLSMFFLFCWLQRAPVFISLITCGAEIMFLGGVIFAWNPVLYTFVDDGIFSDKCVTKNVSKVPFSDS